ncbi:Cdc6/Cdc18 family protein [Halolamina salifodinae]|uniref:Cdc6-like AAA superfamily ATPase n=1 Tax=Halolamina salifodinae TaxID=1202767 RepID=A0A8T4GXC3_9EURY|nr:Cdc6/Cdc18 family protein [Halolamina salifodinae]MBP1985955.1 Cdc6-like AAA superfamily ATPase [Halolamina salifodinae]
MFSRREVFTEHFLPRDLPGRGTQLNELSDVLEPAAEGEPAESCWMIGSSGAGKTSTARYLLEELSVDYGIGFALVECVGASRWELLRDIAAEHPSVPQHNGMGTTQLLTELDDVESEPFVVVLDEFDGLEVPEVLVDLTNIEGISLICIGHDKAEAIASIPNAVKGLRHAPEIWFEPYSVPSMMEILRARVDTGLQPGVIDDDQLERIADEVAGSARYGVQSLRSAVELGEERGHTSVTDEDVGDSFDHAKARIREQLLASLSRQHHIVYRVIREAGEEGLRPAEIMERYRERSDNPRGRQAVVKYRRKLQRYDLVACDGDGSSRWDHWWAVDDQLKAPLRGRRVA